MDVKEKTLIMQRLLYRLASENDHDTKCMVVILITRLATLPTQNSRHVFEEFVEQVKDEMAWQCWVEMLQMWLANVFIWQLRQSKSTKVKHQLYRGITKLLLVRELGWKRSPEIGTLLVDLSNFAVSELADTHHLIRAASIQALSVLSSVLFQVSQYKRECEIEVEKEQFYSRSSQSSKIESTSTTAANALDRIEIQRIISNYVVDSDQRVRKVWNS